MRYFFVIIEFCKFFFGMVFFYEIDFVSVVMCIDDYGRVGGRLSLDLE